MSATQPFRHSAPQLNVSLARASQRMLIRASVGILAALLLFSGTARAQNGPSLITLVTDQKRLSPAFKPLRSAGFYGNQSSRGCRIFSATEVHRLFLRRWCCVGATRLLQFGDAVLQYRPSRLSRIVCPGRHYFPPAYVLPGAVQLERREKPHFAILIYDATMSTFSTVVTSGNEPSGTGGRNVSGSLSITTESEAGSKLSTTTMMSSFTATLTPFRER